MTNAQIAHAFPGLSEEQALLALLSETLEMAREDYQEALTTKRTLSLSRGRSGERETERET